MPMVTIPVCDVFRTRGDDVKEVEIQVVRAGTPAYNQTFELLLSRRAFDRLVAALVPPKTRKKASRKDPADEVA